MSRSTKFIAAMGTSLIGTLCFIAAQPRFAFLSAETGKFAGIAFFLVSGLIWAAFGMGARKEED